MRDNQGRLPGGGDPELGLEGQVGRDKGGKGPLDQRAGGSRKHGHPGLGMSPRGVGDRLTHVSSYYKASP